MVATSRSPACRRDLAKRWSARTEDIERAARTFRERYGREPRGGELGALTVATRGTKTALAQVDVDQAWRAVGEEHGLSQGRSAALFGEQPRHESRPLGSRLLETLTRDRSIVERRELDAQAAELAAGVMRPAQARHVVAELTRAGELVELDGGWWTTRELRELEQQTLSLTDELADQRDARECRAGVDGGAGVGAQAARRPVESRAAGRAGDRHGARRALRCWSVRPGPARAS